MGSFDAPVSEGGAACLDPFGVLPTALHQLHGQKEPVMYV